MGMENARRIGLERALLALFVLSGFAGLIYQSIWSHYLGLTLGHAAYAQTLVLGIFMGGMAAGAWLVSHFGTHWRRLIFAYAVVEIIIGMAGLLFHGAFVGLTDLSQQSVYPALESPAAVRLWQWGSAAVLILPQCILLGMTFPLMSAGYLRIAPRADGEILGGLYFSNSIGAAFGALCATFLLLPWVGMQGTVGIAGALNLLVGVLALLAARAADRDGPARPAEPASPSPSAAMPAGLRPLYLGVLAATFGSGAASFVYEITWVRLLNQVLGTTLHSFELMLSAFILGLALGGYWVRNRSAHIQNPFAMAGYAQVLMGIAALISLPLFAMSPGWMAGLMGVLPRTDAGYDLFMLASAGISLLIMLPSAFFAGMTLPLFTMTLLRQRAGEASIGKVYAANTLGAIVGVALAVHVLIPLLGLHWALSLAAVIDIAIGVAILRSVQAGAAPQGLRLALVASLGVLAFTSLLGKADPRALASGVYRHGQAMIAEDSMLYYFRDGKTATISFVGSGSIGVIATNGKADASIEMDVDKPPAPDEPTMIMAASLPLGLHPNPERVAIIGWGSGLTTHALLASQRPDHVDNIEIEYAMYRGAQFYGSRVARAYADPRSALHIDDARTFFSTGKRHYDVIISEPSNPWVSGVANLFTQQFYAFLRRHLAEGGVLVQWLHAYEINDALLGTMLAALLEEFPYVEAYITNDVDLLFVASSQPIPPLRQDFLNEANTHGDLTRVGLGSPESHVARKLGDWTILKAITLLTGSSPHSDFFPTVSLQAPRARFLRQNALIPNSLLVAGLPVLEAFGVRPPMQMTDELPISGESQILFAHAIARGIREQLVEGSSNSLGQIAPEFSQRIEALQQSLAGSQAREASQHIDELAVLAERTLAFLDVPDHQGLWTEPVWVDPATLPERSQLLIQAYAACARRDPEAMIENGLKAFESLEGSSHVLAQEHTLLIAMLGFVRNGEIAEAVEIERRFGSRITSTSPSYFYARALMLAWEDAKQARTLE